MLKSELIEQNKNLLKQNGELMYLLEFGKLKTLDSKCQMVWERDSNAWQLKQEIDQLQNNWNELKKWLIQLQKFKGINQQGFSWGVAQEVLDKMQEIEGGVDKE